MKILGVLAVGLVGSVMAHAAEDPFLWLEDVRGDASLSWVKARNETTQAKLKSDPRYAAFEAEMRAILTAKDRIPAVSFIGDRLYNLWQDAEHVQGLWRRTTVDQYGRTGTRWETVLDLDRLSKTEGKTWVFKGAQCLQPQLTRCLLTLSDAGKDAAYVREFDLSTNTFVRGGFELPEAKSDVVWVNEHEILVGTDFGEGTMTDSGYPRQIKRLRRGQALKDAKLVLEGIKTDVSVAPLAEWDGTEYRWFATRSLDFYNQEISSVSKTGRVEKLDLPTDVNIHALQDGFLLLSRLSDWALPNGRTVRAGSVVARPVSGRGPIETVWEPTDRTSLEEISTTRRYAILNVMDTVKSRAYRLKRRSRDNWETKELDFPANGYIGVMTTASKSDAVIASYQDFLTPPTVYSLDLASLARAKKALRSLPARFNAEGATVEQRFAKSRDGTEIPYFVVTPKDAPLNGKTPTILYGYGGFMVSETPYYLGATGKTWIEKGGAYVVANIRGGGEFGPAWHDAALKEKRQNAYDDFYAVAEDLIHSGFTSPAHLGIEGGSNGGLLVGVAMTQRPDLFNAVVCSVPLLDMLRYHLLLAGASWMGEYGNPDVPEERAYIEKYSPYQNLRPGVKYPEVFFTGSTADDRVHPGHARKMAAKLESLGSPFFFFENTEGGHGGAANLEQKIKVEALQTTYFWKKLGN